MVSLASIKRDLRVGTKVELNNLGILFMGEHTQEISKQAVETIIG